MKNFKHFDHDFIYINLIDIENDYMCSICNIRVHKMMNFDDSFQIHEVVNYNIVDYGSIGEVYNLTCNEQQIKNLLE